MGLDNPSHIALVVVVLLLLFGARRLPEIGRSLGHGIREFKGAVMGESEQAESPVDRPSLASAPSADAPAPPSHEQTEHVGTPTV